MFQPLCVFCTMAFYIFFLTLKVIILLSVLFDLLKVVMIMISALLLVIYILFKSYFNVFCIIFPDLFVYEERFGMKICKNCQPVISLCIC